MVKKGSAETERRANLKPYNKGWHTQPTFCTENSILAAISTNTLATQLVSAGAPITSPGAIGNSTDKCLNAMGLSSDSVRKLQLIKLLWNRTKKQNAVKRTRDIAKREAAAMQDGEIEQWCLVHDVTIEDIWACPTETAITKQILIPFKSAFTSTGDIRQLTNECLGRYPLETAEIYAAIRLRAHKIYPSQGLDAKREQNRKFHAAAREAALECVKQQAAAQAVNLTRMQQDLAAAVTYKSLEGMLLKCVINALTSGIKLRCGRTPKQLLDVVLSGGGGIHILLLYTSRLHKDIQVFDLASFLEPGTDHSTEFKGLTNYSSSSVNEGSGWAMTNPRDIYRQLDGSPTNAAYLQRFLSNDWSFALVAGVGKLMRLIAKLAERLAQEWVQEAAVKALNGPQHGKAHGWVDSRWGGRGSDGNVNQASAVLVQFGVQGQSQVTWDKVLQSKFNADGTLRS